MKKRKKKAQPKLTEELQLRPVIKELVSQGSRVRHHRALINILDFLDREGIGTRFNDPLIKGSVILRIISGELPEISKLVRQHHGTKSKRKKQRA